MLSFYSGLAELFEISKWIGPMVRRASDVPSVPGIARSGDLAVSAHRALSMQSEPGPEIGHGILFVLADEVEFG